MKLITLLLSILMVPHFGSTSVGNLYFNPHPSLIYAVNNEGEMLLYEHSDLGNWNFTAKKIGQGWDFKQILIADFGYIYAIKENGDMYFYKHDGNDSKWSIAGEKIGNGWNFKQVFTGIDGLIYAVKDNGDLYLYKFSENIVNKSPNDSWVISGKKIGNGWHYRHLFAGTDGRIYGIKNNGDMFLYQHDGNSWEIKAKKIGSGWDFEKVFAGDNGYIYGVKNNGDMLLYQHEGGGANWPINGMKIGNGWKFNHLDARYK